MFFIFSLKINNSFFSNSNIVHFYLNSLKKIITKRRQKKKKRDIYEDLTDPLPEVRTYGQGFNLNESLLSQSSPESLHTDSSYSERSMSPLSHDSDDQQLLEARDQGRKTKKSLRHHR
mgnify:CR=1